MKYKILDLIAVFVVQLVLTIPFYTADAYGLSISNVRVTKATSNSATIEWRTNNISDGKITYGKTSVFGFVQRHDNYIENHTIVLFNGIESDTKYLFTVESTDLQGSSAIDNNSNNFYTFKTTDITPPQQVIGLKALSATSNSIFLSWDAVNASDFKKYVLYRNGVQTANTTKNSFNDTQLNSNTNFNYRVSAVDTSGNEGSFSDITTASTLFIDLFRVKSCDAFNNCVNSSNITFTSGFDSTLPFINLSIPRFVKRRVIDILGSTKPFTSVALFVNDMNTPKRSLSNVEIGKSGIFVFSQVQLDQENIIKIVMTDRIGNKNEKTFEVTVDTQEPIVQLNDVPSLTSQSNLTISGSVNKPVTIKVFVDANVNESVVPSMINGLNAAKIGKNSIELRWNESKDKEFSHYAVYRDNGVIAITKPANFNLFIDALVDSGKAYTYQVSAVNNFAVEGPKSDEITATALTGGDILNLKYAPVDIFEDFRKPFLVLNASSNNFNFGIKLGKGDATYKIKLKFEDRANNTVTLEKNVALETKKPEVKITSPVSGTFIYENVANEVDVIGKTKPNARVHLFVDRTPFSVYNHSFEISGLSNEIQNLPEAKLDAKCRSKVISSVCGTGADFSVDADSQGNFKFEKVDLTAIFGGAARIREVPATQFTETQLNQEAKDSRNVNLLVISTDRTVQRGIATQTVKIGNCWSGNQSWDVIPLTRYQSPTFLSTERLSEGTETIYFYFNYSYIGRGQDAKITDVSLSRACGSRETLDPRFNISCQILPAGNTPTKLNKPDNTLSYSAILLGRFPGMDQFLENDWKGFFKAINKELTFPLKVRVTYEHEIIDENGETKKAKETQTTCEQVSYVVDNTIVDPRKALPDFLLFDFVNFLKRSINTITKVQEQIGKILDYVALGCLISFGTHLIVKIYRIWVEFADEKLIILKAGQFVQFNLGADDKNQDCTAIREAVKNGYGSMKLKYFNDADLKKCFPASASAWETESKMYALQRWSCDRVFGHSAPSKWTEAASDDELHRQLTSEKTCGSDSSVQGQKIRAENCRTLITASFPQLPKDAYNLDDKCFKVEKEGTGRALFKLGNNVNGKIYEIEKIAGPAEISVSYAIKVTENDYLTKQQKTCAEVCGGKAAGYNTPTVNFGGQTYFIDSKGNYTTSTGSEEKVSMSGCVTVNQCRQWKAAAEPDKGGIQLPNGKTLDKYDVDLKGYTSDCFYEYGKSPEVVSDTNPNVRTECCCVNGAQHPFNQLYYQPKDVDEKLIKRDPNPPVHESKTKLGDLPSSYSDMKWSYRYSTIGYLNKKYNPNRYVDGRDQSACFGQNNLFYQAVDKEKELLIVDPFKQDTATLQCLYLTGINQRLQLIKNIMSAMSTCLIQVRTTGRAGTGVCKELFTQHLCGLIWQGIKWFVDGCSPFNLGADAEAREDDVANYVRLGFRGITQGISEAQKEISQDYANAKLNDLLGTGEESVARKVCLAAFGYDWEINVRNLVDAAYSAPYATLVQAVTRSREFLTVDPVTLKPRYEYRASWIINPGCDLDRYDIRLACVSRKELDENPNSINCGSVGAPSVAYTGGLGTSTGYNQCDCLNLPQEQTTQFFSENRLKQNSLVDKNFHQVVDSNVRYDHLKFILRTDNKIAPNAKSNCFPTGYEKGVFYFPLIDKTARDITDCTLQPESGLFICGGGAAFFSRKGTAELNQVRINGNDANNFKEASIGDKVEVEARVTKTGQDKCIRVSISPDAIQPETRGISVNGTSDIAPIRITDDLRIQGRTGDVNAPRLSASLRQQNNDKLVTISLKVIDNRNGNNADKNVYSVDDQVYVDGNKIDQADDGNKLILKEGTYNFDTVKVTVSGKTLTIEKNNAVIEIKDVTYTQLQKDSYEYQEVININPPQQTTQSSQQKTILVELFHVKDNVATYDNPDDCSFNDKINSRTYKFLVTDKSVDKSTSGPIIQNPKYPQSKNIGDAVEISARITHPSGVDKADISIFGPDNDNIKVIGPQPMTKVNDDVGYLYKFDTTDQTKGAYSFQINATSTNNKKSTVNYKIQLTQPAVKTS